MQKSSTAFGKKAFQKGFDPWITDKQGNSLLSVFIRSRAFAYAKALLEVACQENYATTDVKLSLLNIICQDKSTRTHWKSNLVDIILKSSTISHLFLEQPLRLCCKNIVQFFQRSDSNQGQHNEEANDDHGQPPLKKRKKDKSVEDDDRAEANDRPMNDDLVHCKIAKQLILFGADIRIPDSSGESCLDIANNCPFLHNLITKEIDVNEIPKLIPWTSSSEKFRGVLNKVARKQECLMVKKEIWYHCDRIGTGSFGDVFAGISAKDGREVAVKRILKSNLMQAEDQREIKKLTALADCEEIVSYICFKEDKTFSYIVLELMEGNLQDYLRGFQIKDTQATLMCKDVVNGLNFLHKKEIVHCDLKPQNILYKLHPETRLKIADFGLSRDIHSISSSSHGIRGTRCWIAPEVFKTKNNDGKVLLDVRSDVFSCGLLLHYILSEQKHPFEPVDCANKGDPEIDNETETNIMNDKKKRWNNSLHPEASHLLKRMLERNVNDRPTAEEAKNHPLFWSNKKKIDFLKAVANQKEIGRPRAKSKLPHGTTKLPLTQVESDLDNGFGAVFKHSSWDSSKYKNMPDIYTAMTTGRGRSSYDTSSAVELVRFIRNVYEHYKENTFNTTVGIEEMLFKDVVFLKYFPGLVIEIYKAVTTHGWDKRRGDIESAMKS